MINPYCTLSELKSHLGIDGAQTAFDDRLEGAIEAASRAIDHHTGRRFYAAAETRYYTAEESDVLNVDDLLSVTTLKTISANNGGARSYGDVWATTDYDLEPYNAPLAGRPYTAIRVNPAGRRSFPLDRKGVEIAGSWGYSSSAPVKVREACILQAARLFRRKDAPFGVAGSPEMGQMSGIPRLDPDVQALLQEFRRLEVAAA